MGPLADRISLDFALEAKCYARENGVGVKELSRLISRLRHRQFGILVTTSYLGHEAYQELRSDRHPVVVIARRRHRRNPGEGWPWDAGDSPELVGGGVFGCIMVPFTQTASVRLTLHLSAL